MKYSIIIPTLNEEKLLPGLLESLGNPSLKSKFDYEIIVSDGGSSDGTLEIAKQYCDKVLCYQLSETRTISACRSKGAGSASGDNLLFINADVRIDLDKLLSMAQTKFASNGYVAMTCPIRCLPEQENMNDRIFSLVLNVFYFLSNLLGRGIARGECQLIRRKVYESVGGYKEELVTGEDFELFTRLRKHGRVLFLRGVTVYESPRRYRRWGYWRTVASWILSAGPWTKLKRFYKEWEAIR
ncbi:MAG TPA: glycosyltransferase [Candidatus Kryptonia bacterium]